MLGSVDAYENAFRRVFGRKYFSQYAYDKNDLKIGCLFDNTVFFIRNREDFLMLLYKFGKDVQIESSVDEIENCCRVSLNFTKRKSGKATIYVSLPLSYLEFDQNEEFFPISNGCYVVRFLDRIVVSKVFFNRDIGEDCLLNTFDKVERTSESQYKIDVNNNIYYEMNLKYF